MFASKTPRDLNRDPLPWRVAVGPWRGSRMDARYAAEAEHDPRPEFDHPQINEPNPILVELRELRGADWARPERYAAQYAMFLRWVDDPTASRDDPHPWTDAQRDHARRVLTRLAALSEQEPTAC